MGIRVDARPRRSAVGNDVPGVGPAIDAESQPTDDTNPQVMIATRTWAGTVYVIAVNAGDSPTDVTIDVPSLHARHARMLTVLGESRRIDSNGGSFVDHFDPLDVHIYLAT